MTAHASPQGQWQGSDLVKERSTAKGLREEEKAEDPITEGNRQIHPNGYQVENLEERQTTVLINSVLSVQTSLLRYNAGCIC